jgi:hypothetical protein
MAEWVRDDVKEYLAAAATGFESYKMHRTEGEPAVNDGERVWASVNRPLLANTCFVIERTAVVAFMCELAGSARRAETDSQYDELVKDVTAALPQDWRRSRAPLLSGALAQTSFRSSGGTEGEIWIVYDALRREYEVYFQILAPRR